MDVNSLSLTIDIQHYNEKVKSKKELTILTFLLMFINSIKFT